jgi:hypothetical protein
MATGALSRFPLMLAPLGGGLIDLEGLRVLGSQGHGNSEHHEDHSDSGDDQAGMHATPP